METTYLAVNAVGKARRVTIGGREYLDVPMTSIVEGVLNGSKGPLYYPGEEIKANPAQWDGATIVVYHPSHPATGMPLSVDDPAVPDAAKIGVLRNTRVREVPGKPVKLQHVGRFDVEKTRAYDEVLNRQGRPQILPKLEKGEPVELSTGLFTHNAPAPQGFKDWRGLPYSGMVARKYGKDHLAILPDQRGACSVNDGCGAHVDNQAAPTDTIEATYNRDWPQAKRDKLDHGDFAGPGQSFPIQTQADVDAAAHLIGKAADPAAVKARIKAIAKRKGLTVPNSWTTNMNPTWNSDRADGCSKDAMGASDAAGKAGSADVAKAHQAAADLHLRAAKAHDKAAKAHGADGNSAMESKHGASASDHLRRAADHRDRAAFVKGSTETHNHSTEGRTVKKTELVQWLTTNCAHFKDKTALLEGLDEGVLNGMKADAEKALAANAAPVHNCGKQPTFNDLLAAAPAETQEDWQVLQQSRVNEKNRLIGVLTANMTKEQADAARAVYAELPLPKLTTLASAMPAPVANKGTPQAPIQPAPIFVGSAVPAAPPAPVANYDGKKNPLRVMTDEDYDEYVANSKKQSA